MIVMVKNLETKIYLLTTKIKVKLKSRQQASAKSISVEDLLTSMRFQKLGSRQLHRI